MCGGEGKGSLLLPKLRCSITFLFIFYRSGFINTEDSVMLNEHGTKYENQMTQESFSLLSAFLGYTCCVQ